MLFLVSIGTFSQSLPADKIIGTWINESSDVGLRFDIFQLEGTYFGKLVWASTMVEADGKTAKKDGKIRTKRYVADPDKISST